MSENCVIPNEDALIRLATDANMLHAMLIVAREERDALVPLARLGMAALEACREGGDYDGGDIQDKAVEVGVVSPVPVSKADYATCGEGCICEEYDANQCHRDTAATAKARTYLTAAQP